MLRSGSAADTQSVATYVQLYIAQHQADVNQEITVKTAVHMAQSLVYEVGGPLTCLCLGIILHSGFAWAGAWC